jgi:hypothetical protein
MWSRFLMTAGELMVVAFTANPVLLFATEHTANARQRRRDA